ncbi:hypothetical protein [Pseudoalteromonas ruthenica]|uniref:Uncharacterized protein n=1 Tax=Pseudoalteromonas ruthenica TaxID=151081 RepID=A0A0F4PQG5_9GAMM|nr:hypothetical protein [Pseudoalteromonas ruthenica]KJY97652.1 hypothetical protein TW76_07420 [Pseudoalteromonas ruthenica]KJZ01679.1 hypothetical protein TW72_01635 [Pseudoalteromonas ruthenica]TMO94926.1 hypothetical protein CWC13_01835 [Pseudoalteromonas ruthenica]TMO97049.1 hypothetical protein CWC07_15350 [Pseudoalteromonas ruthenica]TMP06425.1 hypothetical protein CWC09_11865 [Pseudoalteromonas ruthenica]
MSCKLELNGLDAQLTEQCEQEFQRQAALYDGELFWYLDSVYCNIELNSPSIKSQVVLANFANSACPFSSLRFAASLYPYNDFRWPVHSHQAAIFYMLAGLEIVQNLKYEQRIAPAMRMFESTTECKSLMHIAAHIISTNSLSLSICPEIHNYVEQHLGANYIDRGEH